MEVLFVLFAVALLWLYVWAKRRDAQEKKRQQRVLNLYEDQKKVDESLLSGNSISSTHNARIKTRGESSQKPSSAPSETGERPTYISQQRQAINETSEQSKESLNTGIPELDGPGMFHRLLSQGPSASAVYLLYSKKHNAYKVGYCEPRGIANRIRQIKPEVPDVILDGTAVFTTTQNAFDAEQRILKKYSAYRYRGINGRWSGSTEWITQRPTGKPYLLKPSKVEERYQKELDSKADRPVEQDIYTVYLMRSSSKGIYKASWCKTENLRKKLRAASNEIANDVEIIARFPIQTKEKARAVAIDINKKAGTFLKNGRKESYAWAANPSYLNSFKDYGPDAKKLD
tara:strand:+ start:26 stop:1057 length:1032 start_codon:yes stop_codon:yes gene_type:complete